MAATDSNGPAFQALNRDVTLLALYRLAATSGVYALPEMLVLEDRVVERLAEVLTEDPGLRQFAQKLAKDLARMRVTVDESAITDEAFLCIIEDVSKGKIRHSLTRAYLFKLLERAKSDIWREESRHRKRRDGEVDQVVDDYASPVAQMFESDFAELLQPIDNAEREVCLHAIHTMFSEPGPGWYKRIAQKYRITIGRVKIILNRFATWLADRLKLNPRDTRWLKRILRFENRRRGWKSRLAAAHNVESPTVTRYMKKLRRKLEDYFGLDSKPRKAGARRRARPQAPQVDGERERRSMTFTPEQLYELLRSKSQHDDRFCQLLDLIEDGTPADKLPREMLLDEAAFEELLETARTRLGEIAHSRKRAWRQYKQMCKGSTLNGTASPFLADGRHPIAAWLEECASKRRPVPFSRLAETLDTDPVTLIETLNELANIEVAAAVSKTLVSDGPTLKLKDGELHVGSQVQVVPSDLVNDLDAIINAVREGISFLGLHDRCGISRQRVVLVLVQLNATLTT